MAESREARTAARWWVEHARHECRQDLHGGPEVEVEALLATLDALREQQQEVSPEDWATFERELAQNIDAVLVSANICRFGMDYAPKDAVLGEALRAAGITSVILPFKTRMRVVWGTVQVSHGEGAPYQVVPLLP